MRKPAYQRPFRDLQEVGLKARLERIENGIPLPSEENLVLAAGARMSYRIVIEPPEGRSWRDLLESTFSGGPVPQLHVVAFWSQASPVEEKVRDALLQVDHEGPVQLDFDREWYQHGPKVGVSVRIVLAGDVSETGGTPFTARERGSILYHHTLPILEVEGEGGHFAIVRSQMGREAGVGRVRFDGTSYHIEINSTLIGDDDVAAVGILLARAMRHACETAPGTAPGGGQVDIRDAIREYTPPFGGSGHTIQHMVDREKEEPHDMSGSMLERWCVREAEATRNGGMR